MAEYDYSYGDSVIWQDSGKGKNNYQNQQATVNFCIPIYREVGPMYRIKFADGYELNAFEDELTQKES